MKRAWNPAARCTYAMVVGDRASVCQARATYIILAPPLAFTWTPSLVYTTEENPRSKEVQARPAPLYCRTHAYLLCGRDPGGTEGKPPPQGQERGGDRDDATLL